MKPVILMYHRIGSKRQGDPWDMTVGEEMFAAQVEQLASTRRVLPISEFVERFRSGSLDPCSAAVTFDDGYADNLSTAKPILERNGVPATLFVCPAFVGRPAFWWDRLQRIVWTAPSLPDALALDVRGQAVSVSLAPGTREGALATLWQLLRDLGTESRDEHLDKLRDLLHADDRSDFRPMTSQELRSLADGHFEIGAHTVTHAWLPSLPREAKQREVAESLSLCRDAVGYAPRCFSYPYGAMDDESRDIVRSLGFKGACSVRAAAVTADCDPFALPRIGVMDEMDAFTRVLGGEA